MASTSLTYTQQTPTTAEARKFTFSAWVKKCKNAAHQGLYGNTYDSTHRGYIYFDNNDKLGFWDSTGTNFISVPQVEAINSSGAITAADSITYTSATTIVATFTLATDGTYFLRVENNDGNAVRSSTALLTVSDAPAWVTASGTLGTFSGTVAIATQTLTATDATSFAITSGGIATGLTFTTGVGSCTITGTQTEHSAAATDNFTVTATDAQGQTAARAFSMSWSFGIGQGGQFN